MCTVHVQPLESAHAIMDMVDLRVKSLVHTINLAQIAKKVVTVKMAPVVIRLSVYVFVLMVLLVKSVPIVASRVTSVTIVAMLAIVSIMLPAILLRVIVRAYQDSKVFYAKDLAHTINTERIVNTLANVKMAELVTLLTDHVHACLVTGTVCATKFARSDFSAKIVRLAANVKTGPVATT